MLLLSLTTWALAQGCPIVNPDAIRLGLHGQRFVALAEPFVWAIAMLMVRALFLAGHSKVIVDATNVSEKRREQWRSDSWTTSWKIIDTTAETCIERAKLESDDEIVPVIERMSLELVFPTANLA